MSKEVKKDRDRDCQACRGKCCRHVATGIDKPMCKRDYDNIRWYLLHENVNVFVDLGGEWTIEFFTPCKNLLPNNQCGDYENRPKICRDYPADDETCEYENDDSPFKLLFTNAKEFEDYLTEHNKDWRWNKLPA